MTLKNNRTPLLCYFKLYASFQSHWWIRTGVTVQKRPIWVKIGDFFVPCDLEIRQMTLNKANLRDLIAATGLVILLKLDSNCRFFSLCDLEIGWMTQKNNRALFYATLSFLHHFVAIGEFKLELQSANTKFGSKSTILFSRVTLKFDGWPSKIIGHLFSTTSSFVQHFVAIGEFKLELQSGNS